MRDCPQVSPCPRLRFRTEAQASTRGGSDWTFEKERESLQSTMNEIARSKKRLADTKLAAAKSQQEIMRLLQVQHNQIQQLQVFTSNFVDLVVLSSLFLPWRAVSLSSKSPTELPARGVLVWLTEFLTPTSISRLDISRDELRSSYHLSQTSLLLCSGQMGLLAELGLGIWVFLLIFPCDVQANRTSSPYTVHNKSRLELEC